MHSILYLYILLVQFHTKQLPKKPKLHQYRIQRVWKTGAWSIIFGCGHKSHLRKNKISYSDLGKFLHEIVITILNLSTRCCFFSNEENVILPWTFCKQISNVSSEFKSRPFLNRSNSEAPEAREYIHLLIHSPWSTTNWALFCHQFS